LILFTAEALKHHDDWSAAQAYAKSCVAKLNERVFPDSGIDLTIRLVDVAVLDLKEPAKDSVFQQILDTLTEGKSSVGLSGKKKGAVNKPAADYRNVVKADLVSLFVASREKAGLAWPMKKRHANFEKWAFSVVNAVVADEYLAFAHELGHNFGCGHERGQGGGRVTPYAFGYEFGGGMGVPPFRTIMCESNPRIELFSNPNKKYMGQPAGVAINQKDAAFNAKVMNDSAATVTAFR
jgi:hypothetical protein